MLSGTIGNNHINLEVGAFYKPIGPHFSTSQNLVFKKKEVEGRKGCVRLRET